MMLQISEASTRMERAAAEVAIGGKTFAGHKPEPRLSPEQEARKKGEDLAANWFSKKKK